MSEQQYYSASKNKTPLQSKNIADYATLDSGDQTKQEERYQKQFNFYQKPKNRKRWNNNQNDSQSTVKTYVPREDLPRNKENEKEYLEINSTDSNKKPDSSNKSIKGDRRKKKLEDSQRLDDTSTLSYYTQHQNKGKSGKHQKHRDETSNPQAHHKKESHHPVANKNIDERESKNDRASNFINIKPANSTTVQQEPLIEFSVTTESGIVSLTIYRDTETADYEALFDEFCKINNVLGETALHLKIAFIKHIQALNHTPAKGLEHLYTKLIETNYSLLMRA